MKLTEKQLRKIIRESIEELYKKYPFDPDNHEVDSDIFDYDSGKFKYGVHEIPSHGLYSDMDGKQWDLSTRKGREDYMWDNYSTDAMRRREEDDIRSEFGNKNVGGANWPSRGDSYLHDSDFAEPGSLAMAALGDSYGDEEADWARNKRWASPKGDFRTRK